MNDNLKNSLQIFQGEKGQRLFDLISTHPELSWKHLKFHYIYRVIHKKIFTFFLIESRNVKCPVHFCDLTIYALIPLSQTLNLNRDERLCGTSCKRDNNLSRNASFFKFTSVVDKKTASTTLTFTCN